jgi:hypothetical protein
MAGGGTAGVAALALGTGAAVNGVAEVAGGSDPKDADVDADGDP